MKIKLKLPERVAADLARLANANGLSVSKLCVNQLTLMSLQVYCRCGIQAEACPLANHNIGADKDDPPYQPSPLSSTHIDPTCNTMHTHRATRHQASHDCGHCGEPHMLDTRA